MPPSGVVENRMSDPRQWNRVHTGDWSHRLR